MLRVEPNVVIRSAVSADGPAMARLHARSWRATYTGLLPDRVIDDVVAGEAERAVRFSESIATSGPGQSWLVAELGGQVVGDVICGPSRDPDASADIGEVWAIYLDPEVIGRGIGRRLFAAGVETLVAHGFSIATLWVLENNVRARRFYEVAGWRPDGFTKTDARPGGEMHEVRYRLALGALAGST